jgi:hypothetical protein
MFNFLRTTVGLSAVQAAGFMGNTQSESHFEPRLVEYGYKNSRGEVSVAGKPSSLDEEIPPDQPSLQDGKDRGQPGYGLAQWTGGRKHALNGYATDQHRKPSDLQVQFDYLFKELQESYSKSVLEPLKATDDLEEATRIVLTKFEHPANENSKLAGRLLNAQGILGKYGSSTPVSVTASSGGGCGGSVSIDGYAFPIGPQTQTGNSKVRAMSPLPCTGVCHHGDQPTARYAFDIGRQPGSNDSTGAPVYAITDGTIKRAHLYSYSGEDIPGCYQLQLVSSKDNFWYWYGHMGNMTVKDGDTVKAGQQIAEVGERKCTGNGSDPHLHIDRGCLEGGVPQAGGSPSCRDPGIVPLMNKLFGSLPA